MDPNQQPTGNPAMPPAAGPAGAGAPGANSIPPALALAQLLRDGKRKKRQTHKGGKGAKRK